MSSSLIVLLDTNIVAALFAVSKTGGHVEPEKQLWRSAVLELTQLVSAECLIRVPTPVCYELMAMNQAWFNYVNTSQDEVFRFSHNAISEKIWKEASKYYFTAKCFNSDGKEEKIRTMDPIIAAYSLLGKHYLLTTNQKDFPESHFSVIETRVLVLSGKAGKHRQIVFLLKPKTLTES
jgi:predicted nucleic acid-binding protein